MMASEPNVLFLSESSGAGQVSAELLNGILRVTIEDEPAGDCFIAVFRQGVAAGWIRPGLPTLVDLTRFVGSVDWAAIRTIHDMAPWGTGPAGAVRVAYLVRNSMFGMLIRVTSVLFVRAHHRTFVDAADALDWLRAGSQPASSHPLT